MGVNKVIYGGETLVDLTNDTVTTDTLLKGYTAHNASGNKITGTKTVPTVVTLVSIAITTPPTKTTYTTGETFNPAGMVVTATYSNGVTAIVTGYSYSPAGALASGTTAITISYTEGGITVTATQAITIKNYDATFANNSWADIAEACATNSVPSTWVTGCSKTMTIDGTDYQIDIIGENHDTYASGGVAPLTFQLHDCYGTTYAMHTSGSNVGGWASCAMRITHLPEILSKMPSEVQASIKEVSKLASVGGASTTIDTTSDKLFLLSEVEVFGATNYSAPGEGSQYFYYAAANSAIKKTGGSVGYWWLRSPRYTNSTAFCRVNGSGNYAQSAATTACGVAPAFCF